MEGEIYILDSQKKRIMNLDKTAILLDGNEGKVGWRPSASILVKRVQRVDTVVKTIGGKETLVYGSNVTWIISSATKEDSRVVQLTWVTGLPTVTVYFGHKDTSLYHTILMANEKGGTDTQVLHTIFKKVMHILYPDIVDTAEKWLIIKIDGWPGRLNKDIRLMGAYLFLGVQNTT